MVNKDEYRLILINVVAVFKSDRICEDKGCGRMKRWAYGVMIMDTPTRSRSTGVDQSAIRYGSVTVSAFHTSLTPECRRRCECDKCLLTVDDDAAGDLTLIYVERRHLRDFGYNSQLLGAVNDRIVYISYCL